MDGYGVGEPFFSRRLEENVNLLMKALKDPALPLLELQVIYSTIIPRARMGSESIAHEARGRMGYWLRGHEGERNNYFSKIQLVGQKYRE